MQFRHEEKHEIAFADRLMLRKRLGTVMQPDPHAKNGRYQIRSLYFDTPADTALREKLDGIPYREKYRIRLYDGDASYIRLEKKTKVNGLGNKQSARLTIGQAQGIVRGEIGWMAEAEAPLIRELYVRMKDHGLRPRTIVDYTREPFIYGPGNVRVTLDYDIRTGMDDINFLSPVCITVPAGPPVTILEVKWDAYLPNIIRDIIQLDNCRTEAFSKYAACRIYQ